MSKIEYRKINFPKINWDENDEEDSVPKLSKDIIASSLLLNNKKRDIIYLLLNNFIIEDAASIASFPLLLELLGVGK